MATEREAGPHREVISDELAVGVGRDELREGNVQIVEIGAVEIGPERDPPRLFHDVVEGLVEVGASLCGHGLVGAGQAAAGERHAELLASGAENGGQGVALDLAGDIELGAFVEPRAAHLGVVVGAREPLPPGPPTEPIACLKHKHRVSEMS